MEKYEYRRENLWKDAFKGDPIFEHGDAPKSDKVISFFCKSKPSEVRIIGKVAPPPEIEFNKVVDLKWAMSRLNKTLQYKKTWYGDQDIYQYVALQNYLDQCSLGGYSKCVLSWQEVRMISPKAKK